MWNRKNTKCVPPLNHARYEYVIAVMVIAVDAVNLVFPYYNSYASMFVKRVNYDLYPHVPLLTIKCCNISTLVVLPF